MPGMNGIQFIKEAKQNHSDIKYFILTGFDLTSEILDALNQQIILKYFSKPLNIKEIVSAINENVDATRCGGEKNCDKTGRCLTHYLWEDLSDRIHDFLNQITLGDLVNQPKVQEVANRQEGKRPSVALSAIKSESADAGIGQK